jgi:2-oxoglutarate ferredoxin oxidoreductase subunit beta
MSDTAIAKLSKKDFETDQEVRWCPGCGDYSILANVQKVLPELGVPREQFVFISGIGCSSRFPYYMNTYGFHTIHGRAPTIATGVKIARPDLHVWMVTGDGDALSIGGNHLIHVLRRNINLNIMLFNNRIYGLTKGQYSPTSEAGKKTKSSPMGSVDSPFNPIQLAIGAGGSFIARSIDVEAKHLQAMLKRSHDHKGTSFLEIYQNCNIFNDGAFETLTDRAVKSDNIVVLEHGKPLIFGKAQDKGVRLVNGRLEVVALADVQESDLLVYDETNQSLAFMVAQLRHPTPIGVFYREERPTVEDMANQQLADAEAQRGKGDLNKLLSGGYTWNVK